MSLLTTIAHPGAAGAKRISVSRVATVIMTLAVGVAIGLAIDETISGNEAESPAASGGVSGHEEFLQLNTTDLEFARPAVVATVEARPAAVDPFTYWNTTALDNLVHDVGAPRNAMSQEFMNWNVSALELAPGRYSDQLGPR